MEPPKSSSPNKKRGLLHTSGAIAKAFPFSFRAGADGVGVGRLTAGEAKAGGGESMEGETFNFFFACFASGSEETGRLCGHLHPFSILGDIDFTTLLYRVIEPGGEGSIAH